MQFLNSIPFFSKSVLVIERIDSKLDFLGDWDVHFLTALSYYLVLAMFTGMPLGNFYLVLLGTFLIDIVDHPTYEYVTNRYKETSIELRQTIARGYFFQAIIFWARNHKKENQLLIHSVLGQPILAGLLLYFASWQLNSVFFYLVSGMFLHSLVDQSLDFKRMGHLKHWFFWPIQGKINTATMILFYISMIEVFVYSTFLFIR